MVFAVHVLDTPATHSIGDPSSSIGKTLSRMFYWLFFLTNSILTPMFIIPAIPTLLPFSLEHFSGKASDPHWKDYSVGNPYIGRQEYPKQLAKRIMELCSDGANLEQGVCLFVCFWDRQNTSNARAKAEPP